MLVEHLLQVVLSDLALGGGAGAKLPTGGTTKRAGEGTYPPVYMFSGGNLGGQGGDRPPPPTFTENDELSEILT